jgi:hypothetical protein
MVTDTDGDGKAVHMGKAKAARAQDIRIVILQRGWVAVGRYSRRGDECRLDGASIVRVWGTTRGLPQIAAEGPTAKTVLDPSPPLRFHALTVIATIDCDAAKWRPLCARS